MPRPDEVERLVRFFGAPILEAQDARRRSEQHFAEQRQLVQRRR